MKERKYIYLVNKKTKIFHVITPNGKVYDNENNGLWNEHWIYVDVLATNDPNSVYEKTTFDTRIFNKHMYPSYDAKYITYEQAIAYII